MDKHPYGFDARGALYQVAEALERREREVPADRSAAWWRDGTEEGIALDNLPEAALLTLATVRHAVALVDALHDLRESVSELRGI